jgi:hypothetical protein
LFEQNEISTTKIKFVTTDFMRLGKTKIVFVKKYANSMKCKLENIMPYITN